MTDMYAWWQILRVTAMFQMIFTGMVLPTVIYNVWYLKNGGDEFGCESMLKFSVPLLVIDVVVFIWVVCMAAKYECPLFLVYQIFYEYFLIGFVPYYLVHRSIKKYECR